MNVRRVLVVLLATLVAGALLAPSMAHAAKKKKSGPVVVGTDDKGDWGEVGPTGDRSLAQVGDLLGQDLVGAEIGMADAKTVNFVIKLNSLPALGGMPEITRYIWDFNVNGEFVELDGKFTNYSRGVCDPTSGKCPPPRDPGQQPFFVRGNCEVVGSLTVCQELGIVKANFDASAATVTIPVPAELIGAKPGSKITPAVTIFGGTITAAPSAFITSSAFPLDNLNATGTFVVPKK